jgi:hypothetical protein
MYKVLDTHYNRQLQKYYIDALKLQDGVPYDKLQRVTSRGLTLAEIRPFRTGHVYGSIPLDKEQKA